MTEDHLAHLIRKYAEGKASEEELQELSEWYRAVPPDEVQWPGERREVYERMLKRLQKEKLPDKNRLVRFSWMRAAAVFLIIIGAGYLVQRLTSSSGNMITVANPTGKIQAVHLPDNSTVWLNAASELKYSKQFSKTRNVELEGEAYFEVSHDAGHPFTVTAGDIQTKVLGTSFNIKAYPGEGAATVSLVEGKVEVAGASGVLAVLKPAMQLNFNRQTHMTTTSLLDSNKVLAWKNGMLQFEGESFGNIAKTLERWYGVQFRFADPSIGNCRYYLAARNNTPLNKLLDILTELTGMHYSTDTNKKIITVSGKGCP